MNSIWITQVSWKLQLLVTCLCLEKTRSHGHFYKFWISATQPAQPDLQCTMAYNGGPVAATGEWVEAHWNYVTSTKELVTGISNIFMEIFSVSDHSGERLVSKDIYWSTVACCLLPDGLMFAGLLGCVDVWCVGSSGAVQWSPCHLPSSGPAGVTMNR